MFSNSWRGFIKIQHLESDVVVEVEPVEVVLLPHLQRKIESGTEDVGNGFVERIGEHRRVEIDVRPERQRLLLHLVLLSLHFTVEQECAKTALE